jgi:hypothetical protein
LVAFIGTNTCPWREKCAGVHPMAGLLYNGNRE